MVKDIVLIGAGGFGREVANLIEKINRVEEKYHLVGFLDDDTEKYNTSTIINGYPWLGTKEWAIEHKDEYVFTCTIGKAAVKAKIQEHLESNGVKFESVFANGVYIPPSTTVGDGCVFYSNVGMSVNCKIGKGVLLNCGVTVGHDAVIGDYTAVMPGTGISGECKIGKKVDIGGHAFIIPGRKVGDGAVVAAGSIVFTNVKAGTTVIGNPAKRMKALE